MKPAFRPSNLIMVLKCPENFNLASEHEFDYLTSKNKRHYQTQQMWLYFSHICSLAFRFLFTFNMTIYVLKLGD